MTGPDETLTPESEALLADLSETYDFHDATRKVLRHTLGLIEAAAIRRAQPASVLAAGLGTARVLESMYAEAHYRPDPEWSAQYRDGRLAALDEAIAALQRTEPER